MVNCDTQIVHKSLLFLVEGDSRQCWLNTGPIVQLLHIAAHQLIDDFLLLIGVEPGSLLPLLWWMILRLEIMLICFYLLLKGAVMQHEQPTLRWLVELWREFYILVGRTHQLVDFDMRVWVPGHNEVELGEGWQFEHRGYDWPVPIHGFFLFWDCTYDLLQLLLPHAFVIQLEIVLWYYLLHLLYPEL